MATVTPIRGAAVPDVPTAPGPIVATTLQVQGNAWLDGQTDIAEGTGGGGPPTTNGVRVTPAAPGVPARMDATGPDANINIQLRAKGAGSVELVGNAQVYGGLAALGDLRSGSPAVPGGIGARITQAIGPDRAIVQTEKNGGGNADLQLAPAGTGIVTSNADVTSAARLRAGQGGAIEAVLSTAPGLASLAPASNPPGANANLELAALGNGDVVLLHSGTGRVRLSVGSSGIAAFLRSLGLAVPAVGPVAPASTLEVLIAFPGVVPGDVIQAYPNAPLLGLAIGAAWANLPNGIVVPFSNPTAAPVALPATIDVAAWSL